MKTKPPYFNVSAPEFNSKNSSSGKYPIGPGLVLKYTHHFPILGEVAPTYCYHITKNNKKEKEKKMEIRNSAKKII